MAAVCLLPLLICFPCMLHYYFQEPVQKLVRWSSILYIFNTIRSVNYCSWAHSKSNFFFQSIQVPLEQPLVLFVNVLRFLCLRILIKIGGSHFFTFT